MKRRIGNAGMTGLGGNAKEYMSGKSTGDKTLDKRIKECSKEVYGVFFKGTSLDFDGVDAGKEKEEIRFGIEPSYQFHPLKLICITKNKEDSSLVTGRAFGYYGSNVLSKSKRYGDYKNKSKFMKFVDKWHPILFS